MLNSMYKWVQKPPNYPLNQKRGNRNLLKCVKSIINILYDENLITDTKTGIQSKAIRTIVQRQ